MHGQRVGYIRVSSFDQNPERQLETVSVDRVFTDKASGKDTQRPELENLLAFVREGDTMIVHSMDRLARNLDDLRRLVQELTERGVRIEFVKENLIFTGEDSPMANLMLSVMGAFAEFERALIRERQREGIVLAKQRGVYHLAYHDLLTGLPKRILFIQNLERESARPDHLEFEFTETALIEADSRTQTDIIRLSELGIQFAIDDFGTGFSSLQYLRKFRTDKLKIDREFIKDVESDPHDAEIVKATITLGSALGMATIAEGVETPGQAEFLARHGCDQVQGYLYGRPTTADTIDRDWLLKQKKRQDCSLLSRLRPGTPRALSFPTYPTMCKSKRPAL